MLTGVTITGADTLVNPSDLTRTSARFPFVEWGILLSDDRAGKMLGCARYPSSDWIQELVRVGRANGPWRLSAHICGTFMREIRDCGHSHILSGVSHLGFQRVQLNGVGSPDASQWCNLQGASAAYSGLEFILQVSNEDHMLRMSMLGSQMKRASILFDASGGRGKPIETFPARAAVPIGYAGGIGPDNVVDVVERINASPAVGDYWIDMESGVRDKDDFFDLHRAWDVLRRVEPLVAEQSRRRPLPVPGSRWVQS